jgi:hypothetical protein
MLMIKLSNALNLLLRGLLLFGVPSAALKDEGKRKQDPLVPFQIDPPAARISCSLWLSTNIIIFRGSLVLTVAYYFKIPRSRVAQVIDQVGNLLLPWVVDTTIFGTLALPLIPPDGGTFVTLPDGSGKITAHGTIPFGSEIKVLFLGGIDGTVLTIEDACSYLSKLGNELVCSGEVIVISQETLKGITDLENYPCSYGGLQTNDWVARVTPSGKITIKCAFGA